MALTKTNDNDDHEHSEKRITCTKILDAREILAGCEKHKEL